MSLALQLLGKPSVTVAGKPATVGPKKNLQLLALLALAPGLRLNREHLGQVLWPDEPVSRRKEHLRPVLSRLKAALTELGYPTLLEADDAYVSLERAIPTDLDALLGGEACVAAEFFQPVMSGWPEEVASDVRLRVQTALGDQLTDTVLGRRRLKEKTALEYCQAFLKTYPTSVKGTALYYKLLKETQQPEVALGVLENFELNWLDLNGELGLPDIEEEARKLDFQVVGPVAAAAPKVISLRTWLSVASLLCACVVSAASVAVLLRPRAVLRIHPWELHGWSRTQNTGGYSAYVFCPDGVTWQEASAFARSLGCRLSLPTTESENSDLFHGAGEKFALEDEMPGWLGARDSGSGWVREDGKGLSFARWGSGVRSAGCAGYRVTPDDVSGSWASYPCESLGDGFFLDGGKNPPDQARTAEMVAHWRYSGGRS